MNLTSFGVLLRPGDTIVVSDGVSEAGMTLPTVTFDVLDVGALVASGTAEVPDDTVLTVYVWTQAVQGGPEETTTYTVVVQDGAWTAQLSIVPDASFQVRATVVTFVGAGHNVWTDY